MEKITDEELNQIINVFETITEATEHFRKLMKDKAVDKSVFVFSSIVEGLTMLDHTIMNSNDNQLIKEKEKLNNFVLLIAKELDNDKQSKILEIVQFSLLPTLNKILCYLKDLRTSDIKDITIGVYLDHTNPRVIYPEARIDALVNEAKNQNCKIFFFCSKDVNFEENKIEADSYVNNQWTKQKFDFPTVINNIGTTSRNRQSLTERKLRRMCLVTSFGLGNKIYLPKIILENRLYAELLVPFKIVRDRTVIFDFLSNNYKCVLKPVFGSQGKKIYYIELINGKYKVNDHKESNILSHEEFIDWLESNHILKNSNYIVQQYINAKTKKSEPFDIRAHVQKNYEGKWVITNIYPRIGHSKSILSNISRGGRTQPLEEFLGDEFPDVKQEYIEKLKTLSLDLTKHLDKLYNFSIEELGLDIAIDQDGRFWLYEANNGPQSTYHEKERAVNTIGYAKYIAEKGIVLTNQYNKLKFSDNQFNAKTSKIEYMDQKDKINIGMLIPENEVNQLTVACAYVANYEDVNFFYFAPSDIDFDAMLIRGYFYQDKQWVPKIVEYPDVIYDRLRLRGRNRYNIIYEEFEEIPITNEFHGNSISKLEVYDKLSSVDELKPYIIPYQEVTRVKDIVNFIEKFKTVIVKPEVGLQAMGVHFVKKVAFDQYFVVKGSEEQEMTEFELLNYFRSLIKKNDLIVQKYIETRTKAGNPFDIRAHMMKDYRQAWGFARIYPRVGVNHATISPTYKGGYISDLSGFLKVNYDDTKLKQLITKIEKITRLIAIKFETLYPDYRISELALDLAVDPKGDIYLIEINVNKPGILYHELEIAQHVIPYCISIVQKNEF